MKKKGQYISKKKRNYSTTKVPKQNTKNEDNKKNSLKNNNEQKSSTQKQQPEKGKVKFSKTNTYIALTVILIITFAVFIPTFENEMTNWDDKSYIGLKSKDNVRGNTMMETLDKETITKIFASEDPKELYWMGNYHPLTMLSINMNFQVSGVDEDGNVEVWFFQLTNILLHVISTALLFFLILKLFENLPIAIMTALLFGVHTIHVESVTWISERKDVLYTAFYLASLLSYVNYVKKEKYLHLALSFIFFILSLLSKAQAVSLAVTLVAVDYLLRRQLLSLKVVVEKTPFILIAFMFGYIAIQAQKAGYAIQDISHYPFDKRIYIAGHGYTQYIIKLIAPFNLSAIYPYPDILTQTIPGYFKLGLIPVAASAFFVFYYFNKIREITFGIAFFVLNILLLLQLIPVGSAIYADRYAYIPSIGFFVIIAYLTNRFSELNIKSLTYKIGNIKISFFHIIIAFYSIFLSFMTIEREKVWASSFSLWSDVIEKQPKAVVAHNNRGSEYNLLSDVADDENDYEKYLENKLLAIKDFDNAILHKPDYTSAFYNRGRSKKDHGIKLNDSTLVKDAILDFNSAISIDLEFVIAYQERAAAHEFLGQFQKAISDYEMGLELEPNNTELSTNLGVTYGKIRDYEKAIEYFDFSIETNPNEPSAYCNRGLAKYYNKDNEGALLDYAKSIELDEDTKSYRAFLNRAMLYNFIGKIELAINDINTAIERNPNIPNLYYTRAGYYLRINKKEEACSDFQYAANHGITAAKEKLDKICK